MLQTNFILYSSLFAKGNLSKKKAEITDNKCQEQLLSDYIFIQTDTSSTVGFFNSSLCFLFNPQIS